MTGNVPHWRQEEDKPTSDFPHVSIDLVEALEKQFPDQCPDLRTPDREIWAQVGRVEVVRFLREAYSNQGQQ